MSYFNKAKVHLRINSNSFESNGIVNVIKKLFSD